MIAPVTIQDQQPYALGRLGQPAGYVLSAGDRRTPSLRYRIPERRSGEPRRWLKVVLRARVELEGDHGDRGFGAVSLLTGGYSSASAEFGPVSGPGGRKQVRWTGAALHGGTEVVTARERFRVAFTNYARVQGSSPGVHTLAFRLRLDDGIRVRRVVIEPGSGLSLTRQPPQALAVRSTTVLPASPVVGQPFTVRFSIVNRGVVESGPLTLDPLLPPGIERRGRLPHLASLGPGAARSTDLVYSAARPGAYRIETLASSSVGQALVVARPQVVVAAARRAPAGAEEGGGGGSDGWLLALGVSIVGLAGAGIWRVRRTADARRRHGRGPSART